MGVPLYGLVLAMSMGVDVRLDDSRVPESNRALVSSIFEEIGIRLQWLREEDTRVAEFEIRVVNQAPKSASKDAMASTNLPTAVITVFEDRVRRRAGQAHPAA